MLRSKIIVSPETYWLLCISLLLLPLKLVLAWTISVVVHESFHYLALKACNCSVPSIKIGIFGAQMVTEPLSKRKEIICAAAGPLGGFLLIIFVKVFPLLSVIGFLHSVYNLIPVFPLDGGRIVHCIINKFARNPDFFRRWYDRVVIGLLMLISLYGFFRLSFGILPVVLVISVAVNSGKKIFLQT